MSDYAATAHPHARDFAAHRANVLAVTFEILSQPDTPAEKLEGGEVDLLIYPYKGNSPHHPCEALFQEDFVCVVWSKNTLVKDTITLRQYLAMACRFAVGSHHTPTIDQKILERFGHQRRIEVHATSFNLVPELVVGTKRIATVHRPSRVTRRVPPIRLLEPPIKIPPFTESIQWHKYRDCDPAIRWLRNLFHGRVNPTAADAHLSSSAKAARA